MKIGGWLRLWIVVGVLYFVCVLAAAASLLPDDGQVPQSSVYARMDRSAISKLIVGPPDSTGTFTDDGLGQLANDPRADVSLFTAAERRRMNTIIDSLPLENRLAKSRKTVTVEIAIGHLIDFSVETPEDVKNRVSAEYYTALRRELRARRAAFLACAVAAWLVPMLAVYPLGWSVGWVRRGFRASQ